MATTEHVSEPAAWEAVSAAFGSLGRVCIALDGELRVRHASALLDAYLGAGATAARVVGHPIAELLGEGLFGPAGELRRALLAGERREGWRAPLGEGHLVSVTAAPLVHDPAGACDAELRYLVVVRPADEEAGGADAPTAFAGLVARSPAMLRVIHLVDDLQASEAPVLITGEAGAGKETVARALHAHSPRRGGPFVVADCAALPPDVLERELFGDAVGRRVGRLERAAGGTLLLDEIGALTPALQARVARVLADHVYERRGDPTVRRAEARIVAASAVDLRLAVAAGTFREDLYYRLRVVAIEVPPLRERRPDIEPLARHLLGRVAARSGRALAFSPDAMRSLLGHDWPGNVRELENAVEYAVSVCHGATLEPEDLPAPPRAPSTAPTPISSGERAAIVAALDAHKWSRSDAAQALGISRTTLWRKMRELGLHK